MAEPLKNDYGAEIAREPAGRAGKRARPGADDAPRVTLLSPPRRTLR